jgi:hypothetical protein
MASLLALLSLAAAAASADGWHVGVGPDVLQEAGEDPATRLGGWFDASYEDSDAQGDAGGPNHLNLFGDTRWRNFQAFVEGEYERETDLAGFEEERGSSSNRPISGGNPARRSGCARDASTRHSAGGCRSTGRS